MVFSVYFSWYTHAPVQLLYYNWLHHRVCYKHKVALWNIYFKEISLKISFCFLKSYFLTSFSILVNLRNFLMLDKIYISYQGFFFLNFAEYFIWWFLHNFTFWVWILLQCITKFIPFSLHTKYFFSLHNPSFHIFYFQPFTYLLWWWNIIYLYRLSQYLYTT